MKFTDDEAELIHAMAAGYRTWLREQTREQFMGRPVADALLDRVSALEEKLTGRIPAYAARSAPPVPGQVAYLIFDPNYHGVPAQAFMDRDRAHELARWRGWAVVELPVAVRYPRNPRYDER